MNPRGCIPTLQVSPHAHHRSSRAHSGDEGIGRTLDARELLEDLWTCGAFMRSRVRIVGKLRRQEHARVGRRELLREPDASEKATVPTADGDDRRAETGNQLAAL